MIRALLFDLDGTLIRNSNDEFVPAYFKSAAQFFAGLVPPEKFVQELRRATRYVIENPGGAKTNLEKFQSVFCPSVGLSWPELSPYFDRFYAEQFPRLKALTGVIPEARPVVEAAFAAGKRVVIATNPLFPETAIHQRLAWAGLPVERYAYELVTTLENMHASKPQLAYFSEIAATIGLAAAECLMVGDDIVNDIGAARAGMRIFLVCDPGAQPDAQVDTFGSLDLLTRMLQSGEI